MNKFMMVATIAALGTAAAAQEETTMKMEDVPPAVMEAAKAHSNGVTFDSVAMDDDVYEFAGKMASGMALEVDVMEDGSIEEVEEEITMAELPAEVTAALGTSLPGFTPAMVEKSTRPDGAIVYEFEGTVDGKEIDAEINADGTGFTMNDDMAG